uniref:Uncharacterized protein n=1 Tax=Arundo donax TaxID=35708 RepID=A0A0A9G1B9_ARUDO
MYMCHNFIIYSSSFVPGSQWLGLRDRPIQRGTERINLIGLCSSRASVQLCTIINHPKENNRRSNIL